MKAWWVDLAGVRSLVAAERRAHAVRSTLASAVGAGFRVEWTEARARRAPEWDGWAAITKMRHPTTELFAGYELDDLARASA